MATTGAWFAVTVISKVSATAAPEVSVAVTVTEVVPASLLVGLAVKAPVVLLIASHEGMAEPAEVAASGCAACAGGHRKHTCGRSVLPPPAKVRSEDYCAACHGGHRKHTCARKLGLGDEGGGSSTTGASGSAASGSSEDKASRKRRVGAELSASSDAEAGAAASETGCRACMGWHRGHTCGKSLRGST